MGKREKPTTRVFRALPYALVMVPVAISLWYVHRYGVDAPYNDGLGIIALLQKTLSGELRFGDLIAQHNEHRIFFPRIALILLGLATSFNDVATMYVVQGCLMVTTVLLLLAFRRTVSKNLWPFVPVPFLVFNLGQSWNMLQGFQLTLVFVQTFAVLSFVLLHECGGGRGRLAFSGALGSGTVAAFSSAPGLLVWPLGLLQLLLHTLSPSNNRRKKAGMMGIWGVAGVLEWALYFQGYESPVNTTWRDSLQQPFRSLDYLVSTLGASLFHGRQDLALAGGVLLVFLAAVALVVAYGRGRAARNSVWMSLLAFAFLTVAATSLARGGSLEDALNPKYATYTVLAPVAVYAMLAGTLRGRRDAAVLVPLGLLAALVTVSLPLSYPEGVKEAKQIAAHKQRTAFVLATYESQPDQIMANPGVLREHFRVDPKTSREQARFLESHGYSIFSEKRPRVLPPPLPDPTPGTADAPSGVDVKSKVEASLMRSPTGDAGKSFVKVSGWAAVPGSSKAVNGVYVLVDGRPYPAFYGARSTDAASRLGSQGYLYAGFERSIPVSEIGSGDHELSVVAVTDTGETYLPLQGGGDKRMGFKL